MSAVLMWCSLWALVLTALQVTSVSGHSVLPLIGGSWHVEAGFQATAHVTHSSAPSSGFFGTGDVASHKATAVNASRCSIIRADGRRIDPESGIASVTVDADASSASSLRFAVSGAPVVTVQVGKDSPVKMTCHECDQVSIPAAASVTGSLVHPPPPTAAAAGGSPLEPTAGTVRLRPTRRDDGLVVYLVGRRCTSAVVLHGVVSSTALRVDLARASERTATDAVRVDHGDASTTRGDENTPRRAAPRGWQVTVRSDDGKDQIDGRNLVVSFLPGPHMADCLRQLRAAFAPRPAVLSWSDLAVVGVVSARLAATRDGANAVPTNQAVADLADVTGLNLEGAVTCTAQQQQLAVNGAEGMVTCSAASAGDSTSSAVRRRLNVVRPSAEHTVRRVLGELLGDVPTDASSSAKGPDGTGQARWDGHSALVEWVSNASSLARLDLHSSLHSGGPGLLRALHRLNRSATAAVLNGPRPDHRSDAAAAAFHRQLAELVSQAKVVANVAQHHPARRESLLEPLLNVSRELDRAGGNIVTDATATSAGSGARPTSGSHARQQQALEELEAFWRALEHATAGAIGLSLEGHNVVGFDLVAPRADGGEPVTPPCDPEALSRLFQLAAFVPAGRVPLQCRELPSSSTASSSSVRDILPFLLERHNAVPDDRQQNPASGLLAVRNVLRRRQQLAPYLHTASVVAALRGEPMLRSMGMQFGQRNRLWYTRQQSFLLGPAVAVRPITEEKPIRALLTKPVDAEAERWYDADTLEGLSAEIAEMMMPGGIADVPVLYRGGNVIPMALERRRGVNAAAGAAGVSISLVVLLDGYNRSSGYIYSDAGDATHDAMYHSGRYALHEVRCGFDGRDKLELSITRVDAAAVAAAAFGAANVPFKSPMVRTASTSGGLDAVEIRRAIREIAIVSPPESAASTVGALRVATITRPTTPPHGGGGSEGNTATVRVFRSAPHVAWLRKLDIVLSDEDPVSDAGAVRIKLR